MKKLLACLLCTLLLFGFVACTVEPEPVPSPNPNDSTPNDSSVSDVGGSDDPSSVTTDDGIEDRSALLDGKSLPERALYLWNGLFEESEISDMVSSATQNMDIILRGTMQGYTVSSDTSTKSLLIDGSGAIRPFSYAEGESTTVISDGETTHTTTTLIKSGYANGKIFAYYADENGANGIYASHSPAQWEAYQAAALADAALNPIIREDFCENKSFLFVGRNYKAEFSGFTDEGMDALCRALGMEEMPIDETPTDLLVTATFRRDLLPTEMKITLVFDEAEGDNPPACEVVMLFCDYNATEPIAVDMSGWRDVGSMLTAQRVFRQRDALREASVASFEYECSIRIHQNGEYVTGGTTTYQGLHSNAEDGGYAFYLESPTGDLRYSYANGIYEIEGSANDDGRYGLTDEEARAFMDPFFDPMGMERYWVRNATRYEHTADIVDHTLTLKTCDSEWLADRLAMLNATEADVAYMLLTATCIEDADGNLTMLSYKLSVTFFSGYSLDYIVTLQNIEMS